MVWCLLLRPTTAWAQAFDSATIAGVVKDTSGAVMPGVTVEAASPALIEKVRTVVTDAQGQYKIVDLRPGTYVVTFTLPGFSAVRREDLELTTAFTATVNAELRVGALEETVTVSGAAPIVDTQNVIQQQTLARSTLDALPTARQLGSYAKLLTAAVLAAPTFQDVGGTQGEGGQFAVHGQRPGDINVFQDGVNQSMLNGSTFSFNSASTQEVVLETSGTSAESFTGGVLVNIVPKEGGNTLTGSVHSAYAGPKLQSDNLTDTLRARGLLPTPSVRKIYDDGGSLGGPIIKDRLWFFTAHRWWGASQYQQGKYYNQTQGTLFYTPDLSRPAHTNDYSEDHSVRLTWQALQKHKIAFSYAIQDDCQCFTGLLTTATTAAPEAVAEHHYQPNYIATASWSHPATNRLLFEAGATALIMSVNSVREPEVGPNDIAVNELGTNIQHRLPCVELGSGRSILNMASPSIQRAARGVLHHGVACLQDRVQRAGVFPQSQELRRLQRDQRRQVLQLSESVTCLGRHLGDPVRECRAHDEPRDLCTGSMDHQETYAEPGCAIRFSEGVHPRTALAGRPMGARARFPGGGELARLEEYRPACGSGLRPVWHGQDRTQSVSGPVCAL